MMYSILNEMHANKIEPTYHQNVAKGEYTCSYFFVKVETNSFKMLLRSLATSTDCFCRAISSDICLLCSVTYCSNHSGASDLCFLFLPCSADGLGREVDGPEVDGPGPTGSDEDPEWKERLNLVASKW